MTAAQIRCLLALLALSHVSGQAASKDIAEALGVSRPSVHRLLEALVVNGYVAKEAYGAAMLTDVGRAAAERMAQHKALLSGMLVERFGISETEGEQAAVALMCTLQEETLNSIEKTGKSEQ